jgi:hypothetical protein
MQEFILKLINSLYWKLFRRKKITLYFDADQYESLSRMKEAANSKNDEEIIYDSLNLMRWAMLESVLGHKIGSQTKEKKFNAYESGALKTAKTNLRVLHK